MPFIEESARSVRYQKRCSKKNIEKQNDERSKRYEKRAAMKEEAKEVVSKELKQQITLKKSSSYSLRTQKPMRYGVFGCYF